MGRTKRKQTPKIDPRDESIECCCAVCGGTDVEYAIWHNPNTGETGDVFGSWNAGDNTFCAECDVEGRDCNAALIDKGAEPEEFIAARAKWRAEHDPAGNRTVEIDENGNPTQEA